MKNISLADGRQTTDTTNNMMPIVTCFQATMRLYDDLCDMYSTTEIRLSLLLLLSLLFVAVVAAAVVVVVIINNIILII